MKTEDKIQFVNDLLDGIKASILSKVASMPEEWDGHEIRQYIVDRTIEQAVFATMPPKRMRDYRNEVATRNL